MSDGPDQSNLPMWGNHCFDWCDSNIQSSSGVDLPGLRSGDILRTLRRVPDVQRTRQDGALISTPPAADFRKESLDLTCTFTTSVITMFRVRYWKKMFCCRTYTYLSILWCWHLLRVDTQLSVDPHCSKLQLLFRAAQRWIGGESPGQWWIGAESTGQWWIGGESHAQTWICGESPTLWWMYGKSPG